MPSSRVGVWDPDRDAGSRPGRARLGSLRDFGEAYDWGSFYFFVSPRDGVDLPELEREVHAHIERLLTDGVTAEEVKRAKVRMRAAAVFARDSLNTAPRVIGSSLSVGRAVEDVEAWPERIEAVTVEQVNDAARAVLEGKHSVTSVLLPKPTT